MQMERVLTPCLPQKSCVICESRLYPKSATPAKRAAKYAHQARWYGAACRQMLFAGSEELAGVAARQAAGFARLALDTDSPAALAA